MTAHGFPNILELEGRYQFAEVLACAREVYLLGGSGTALREAANFRGNNCETQAQFFSARPKMMVIAMTNANPAISRVLIFQFFNCVDEPFVIQLHQVEYQGVSTLFLL